MNDREESLKRILETWAQENGLEIKSVRVSIEMKAVAIVPLISSLPEAQKGTHTLHAYPSQELLEESDWKNIFNLPWKPWQKSLIEAAHKDSKHILTQKNIEFVQDSERNLRSFDSAMNSINGQFRQCALPYRFMNKPAGGNWRDGPYKLVKVFFRPKRRRSHQSRPRTDPNIKVY